MTYQAPTQSGRQFLGSAVAGVMRSVRELVERRAAQRQKRLDDVEAALRAGGWIPTVALDDSLPLVTIALRGSKTCGVAMCAGDNWTASRQAQLLAVARQDALDGVLLIGAPAPGHACIAGVEFIAAAPMQAQLDRQQDDTEGDLGVIAWPRMRQA